MLAAITAARQKGYKSNRFRQSFRLNFNDKKIIEEQGYLELEKQAKEIIRNRLKIKPSNDGKQTPYRGHPIFKAQHATACCCRKCVQKWHRIPAYRELNNQEMHQLVNTVMTWIRKEMKGVA